MTVLYDTEKMEFACQVTKARKQTHNI